MVETRLTDRLPPDEPGQRMQRVRVGVTGLAAIVLVVLLATAIASGVRRSAANETAVSPVAASTVIAPSNAVDPKAEPLAQLGAAPGGTTESTVEHSKPAK